MAYSKKDQFSPTTIQLAALAKALSHPARIAILQLLISKKSCICGDIVDELPLSQSTVSQHLKELKKVGLVQGEIDGPRVCYCVNLKTWEEMKTYFTKLFQFPSNCC